MTITVQAKVRTLTITYEFSKNISLGEPNENGNCKKCDLTRQVTIFTSITSVLILNGGFSKTDLAFYYTFEFIEQ